MRGRDRRDPPLSPVSAISMTICGPLACDERCARICVRNWRPRMPCPIPRRTPSTDRALAHLRSVPPRNQSHTFRPSESGQNGAEPGRVPQRQWPSSAALRFHPIARARRGPLRMQTRPGPAFPSAREGRDRRGLRQPETTSCPRPTFKPDLPPPSCSRNCSSTAGAPSRTSPIPDPCRIPTPFPESSAEHV